LCPKIQSEAALVLVAETKQSQNARREGEVRLRVGRIALGRAAGEQRVRPAEVQDGLPCGGESVAAADSHRLAEIMEPKAETIVEGNARRRGIHILYAQARGRVAQQVVPARNGLVLQGDAEITILVALDRIIGDSEERNGARLSQSGRGVASGEAQFSSGIQSQRQVGDIGRIVKRVVGNSVVGIEAGELAEIIEAAEGAGQIHVLAATMEVSSVERVRNFRQGSDAATGSQADHASHGV